MRRLFRVVVSVACAAVLSVFAAQAGGAQTQGLEITLSLDGSCAPTGTSELTVSAGETVTFCYTLTNVGQSQGNEIVVNELVSSTFGDIEDGSSDVLDFGESVSFTESTVVSGDMSESATWTAVDQAGAELISAATAQVNLRVWEQVGTDIDGEDPLDQSGNSVSFSADGNRVAVGAFANSDAGLGAGHVRVFDFNGSAWVQIGADIDGEGTGDFSGKSVSLSADGMRVAIGAHRNGGNGADAGHVRVFELLDVPGLGPAWFQMGPDIDGEAAGDESGFSVSLSADGTRVAVGAPKNDGLNGSESGHARVFDFNGSSWVQVGQDIDGDLFLDSFGASVSLSPDGSRVAVGATAGNGFGSNTGYVRVLDLVGAQWTQVGSTIAGDGSDDEFGSSVSLSADRSRLAIGAPGNDDAGADSGHVRVFQFVTVAGPDQWLQVGTDIGGEAASDFSGGSVSLSADGSRVAIGALRNDGATGADSGHVRVLDFDVASSAWVQVGGDIDGEAASDFSGAAVSLSDDGARVAVGAIRNDGADTNAGHVRVFASASTPAAQFCNGLLVTVDVGAGEIPTAQDDVIVGTSAADTINGLGGNDTICGEGGGDTLTGGPGDDTVFGGAGDDTLTGASGNDTLNGEAGVDTINGGAGDDVINGGAGDDDLRGQGGDDTLNGDDGVDTFFGGSGADIINTGDGGNAGTGIIVQGQSGPDTITGSPQDDVLDGGLGQDEIHGGAGNDVLNGGRSGDDLFGDAGDDQLFGGPDRDALDGGAGTDSCDGGGATNDTATATCETTNLVP